MNDEPKTQPPSRMPTGQAVLAAALTIWGVVWVIMTLTYPPWPPNEMRYVSVAHEMFLSRDYLLPTLNGDPYSHKPPLLFWLINVVWMLTGPSVAAARIVSLATASLSALLTARLARILFPERAGIPAQAALIFMIFPPFLIFGGMIQFDFLLTACVLAALAALYRAFTDRQKKHWLAFGVATGLGILTKGPVMLVHVLPAAVLLPLCAKGGIKPDTRRSWYAGLGSSLLVATALSLCWAVPAALHGGPDYARMIFWDQTEQRVVAAFHHRRPFWFYIPVMLAFTAPLLLVPSLRTALRALPRPQASDAALLLWLWVGGTFALLSLISGKQSFYLLPLFPGLSLLLAAALPEDRAGATRQLLLAFTFWAALGSGFCLFEKNGDFRKYDLAPVNRIVSAYQGKPVAWVLMNTLGIDKIRLLLAHPALYPVLAAWYDIAPAGKHDIVLQKSPYAGELGLTLGIATHINDVKQGDLSKWLASHPDGIAVIRHKSLNDLKPYRLIFTQPYRDGQISVVGGGL